VDLSEPSFGTFLLHLYLRVLGLQNVINYLYSFSVDIVICDETIDMFDIR
jgi:hypothetical protein